MDSRLRGNDGGRSDDLAGLLARTTDDVIPVDQNDTRLQRRTHGAVLLGGQPDRFDNIVRQSTVTCQVVVDVDTGEPVGMLLSTFAGQFHTCLLYTSPSPRDR